MARGEEFNALLTTDLHGGGEARWSRSKRMVMAAAALLGLAAVAGLAARSSSAAALRSRGGLVGLQQVVRCNQGGGKDGEDCGPHKEEAKAKPAEKRQPAGDSACSAMGDNCNTTKCCKDEGMQCYAKDQSWASCRPRCTPGPDPVAADGWPWSCETLGLRTEGEVLPPSKGGEDCTKSKSCETPGLQCYRKGEGYAACKADCNEGVDVTDQDPSPWTCEALGTRTPGPADWVAKECAQPGAACVDKGCCATPGEQCFDKNDYYGECRAECPDGWTCKTHGSRTPLPPVSAWQAQGKVADWVADKCAKIGEDCQKEKCCADAGHRCYTKNSTFATCKTSCSAGPDLYDADSTPWTCEALGMMTPGVSSGALDPWKQGKEVSKWVNKTCAAEGGENCGASRCCKDVGHQCYKKDEHWAACLTSCQPGVHPEDNNDTWACDAMGPRTQRPWESPSLFCLSVIQPFGYELGLVKAVAAAGEGIFACDEYSVFSTEGFYVGEGPFGPIHTVQFQPAKVVQSKDGTAGNAEVFMHVWDAVRNQGLWQAADWTVKVDPDAVLLPTRLRWHLKPHTGKSGFVVNCAKPYMPEGPMMFGALEAISQQGLRTYMDRSGDCIGGLAWQEWGEDLFLNHCFDKLGVARINDFGIYSDGVCRGVDCSNPDAAAFHPKKDVGSWFDCLKQTKNPAPRTTTDAPQWFKDYMASYAR